MSSSVEQCNSGEEKVFNGRMREVVREKKI